MIRSHLAEATLYGILDLGYVDRGRLFEVAKALIAGGADLLQLRAKGYQPSEIIEMGGEVRDYCRASGIPFIVNDFAEAALELDADGLHLGQDDGSYEEARERVGDHMILGRSTHSPEQALAATNFDYIGFGPLFPTPTKKGRPGIGLQDLAAVQASIGSQLPVFSIGGVKRTNLSEVLAAGARRTVIVSDLLTASNIRLATQEAKEMLRVANEQ